MKKLCLTAVAVIASCVLVSCDSLNLLKSYEEELSLTVSEKEECLIGTTWMFSKIGYALEQDKNDVEHIDNDGYPEVSSSIESIQFGEDGSFTVNLKESTKFIERYSDDDGLIKERECWFTTYTATHDGPRLSFGIGDSGVEEFIIKSFVTGGSSFDCSLYGRDKSNGYKVNRMILKAGTGGIHRDTYYEFIPGK